MLHLSSEQRRFALGRRATVVVVIVLCVVIYVLRTSDANAVDGEDVLLVLPLALLALQFGLAGGIAGALIAVALIGAWDLQDKDIGLNVEGYLSWGPTFVLLGALLGAFVDHRRRLEAVLAHYFDGSLDLLATVNLDGWFTRVNPAWERTLGYSAETLCSRPLIEFVHPEDRASTLAENDAVTDGLRDIVGFRNRYRAADGSYRWLEWSGHATLSDGLINAVARDVTVQHEAEEQLARHAEMLESKVAERTRELEDARAKTLRRLALAAEYRDDDTFEHTTRVGSMSAEIGALLGLGEDQVDTLHLAALLHDVGKIGIPDRILLKRGRLTLEEYEVMQTHTILGARLLTGSGSPVLQMATLIAESHHEWWDGKGYPHGISGEAIPLVGRIVAVADVFDALTHDRPYKSAWPVARAIAEIKNEAGSHFDPKVVAAFLETVTQNPVSAAANGEYGLANTPLLAVSP
ncbi:MAG TPA: HD domain-containing phosphohydrolase [Solirubrobacteraceae bacterium]|jgi:PAS domain S-box-containing protein